MTTHSHNRSATAHPIRLGVFVVLAVFLAGALAASVFGYTSPRAAEAQVMVGSVTVTAGTTAASSLSSAVTSVASTVSSVVSSVTTAVTTATGGNTVDAVTVNGSNQSTTGGSTSTTAPASTGATTVSSVTVTAGTQDDGGTAPATTDASGVTQVSSVTVTAATQESAGATNLTTQPCCTLTTPPTTTLPVTTPAVIVPPVIVPPTTTVSTVPACTLTASASSVTPGSSVTLSWTSQHLASGSINNGVGSVSPLNSGSTSVVVYGDTTYTLTGIGTNGQTVTCSAPVTVTTHPNVPVCTLSASASSVLPGSSVTLTWTTSNVASGSINNGIGNATPIASGSRSTVVTGDTTYTLTALGTNGQTVTCSAPVTVTTTNPHVPACTLTASATSVVPGSAVTLSWTSQNLLSAVLNQGIGALSPLSSGSKTVTVNADTTYVMTGMGTNGQTVTCSAPVTVTTTTSNAPACTLAASASSVAKGGSVDLTWTTTNAASAVIDQGVGAASPLTGGTKSATVNENTTYTMTVVGTNGQTITCAAPVTVTTGGGGGGPACTLTADPTKIEDGGSTTLTWGGKNIASVFIDQGVGTTSSPAGSQSVSVTGVGDHTYTGTFTTTSGTTLTCTATVTVTSGGGGCTSGCGGGGGGSRPRILFSSLKNPGEQDLAFVYLSQMPYTGLELGPWGTALYWIMLILWSLAAAYLVFFTALPFAYQRAGTFGAKVKEALNAHPATDTHVAHSTHAAPASHGHAAPAAHGGHGNTGHGHGHDDHGHHAPVEPPKPTLAKDGFRAFGTTGALSIDDIVKGLAREAAAHPEASAHDIRPDFAHHDEVHAAPAAHAEVAHAVVHEEVHVPVAPVAPAPVAHAPVAVSHDVRDFLAALIAGDRDTVFGTVRAITRQGGDSEEFLTHAVCALDDAYRAQVDGSVCHPDIKAITAHCHPSFLERLVSSLTTAVDGSYSTGVTGVKLALTRALAVVNG